ncbi:DUF1015 domain-containing protein [Thermodesulfobacteriota bacterium]
MAIIAPFKALTYDFARFGDISLLMAPPYDIISEEEQDEFYRTHPRNIVRLILGKKKRGDSDWDNRYTRAVDYLARWETEDVLVRSKTPCMYMTSLTYKPEDGGAPRVRWGLIVLVRIEDEDSGIVLPHEKTFSAHKDDRLQLMRACRAQLSQIFALYEDPENKVFNYFKPYTSSDPLISFDFKDGTHHQMWAIRDESVFKKVAQAMREKSIFIADGHHRYETSRNFRNIMRTRYGTRPSGRSYEYVMMYLSNLDDKGLTILPSHRLIKKYPDFQLELFLEKLKRRFEITTLSFTGSNQAADSQEFRHKLEEKGRLNSAIGFHLQGHPNSYLLTLKPGAREEMGANLHPALKELDVLVLSRLILQDTCGFTTEDMDDESQFHYESDFMKAIARVESGDYKIAFLLNPTKIDHVKEVASRALIMPRKSTYFYPKVLTGLVFNKIDADEIIQLP